MLEVQKKKLKQYQRDVIRPLCIALPQKSGFIKYFDNDRKNMSFQIENDNVLVKYNEIWNTNKNTLDILRERGQNLFIFALISVNIY